MTISFGWASAGAAPSASRRASTRTTWRVIMTRLLSGPSSVRRILSPPRSAKHRPVVAVPVALEALVGVPEALEAQELGELGIGGRDLRARGVTVIREEIAAAVGERDVDQAPEVVGRPGQRLRRVLGVEVEDHARVAVARPRQERLAVALDQPHGAVDHVHGEGPGVAADRVEEPRQLGPARVDLGDDLARGGAGTEPAIEPGVVAVEVDAELVGVRPVALAAGGQVVLRVE